MFNFASRRFKENIFYNLHVIVKKNILYSIYNNNKQKPPRGKGKRCPMSKK